MKDKTVDISIVIVNYKVKEYISNLLSSIEKARHSYNLEIFVVDNDSGDDSIEYLQNRYPNVNYIANSDNVGFGKANNQAIKEAKGKYTLIINPDTLVSEDTLSVLFKHMEKNEKCGAAGCKILNPDGTFAPESRRSVPTIWAAACRVFGLDNLFPNSKLFGQYYLSWLPIDEVAKVPVLSGSFMFWRTKVLKQIGGFDERFFMYGEDIDLCYQIQNTGFHIEYVPGTSIIHYKGESTKKGDLRYIKLFNKALYQFYEKNYSTRYSVLFKILIYLAVTIKTVISFVTSRIKKFSLIIADLIVLNLAFVIGFGLRFNFNKDIIFRPENIPFLAVNLIISIIYIIAAGFFGLFKENKNSLSAHLKTIFIAFIGVVIVTFFARDYAFSRLILALSFLIGTGLMVLYRVWVVNKTQTSEPVSGKFRSSRIVIVGTQDEVKPIVSKINLRPDWNYKVEGIVTPELEISNSEKTKVLGSLAQLQELVKAYNIDQVFFSLGTIAYKEMLNQISRLQNSDVIFKLIPESREYILGKANVEYLETIPLVKVELEYAKLPNKIAKRILDLFISIPLLILLAPFAAIIRLFSKKEKVRIQNLNFYKNGFGVKWLNRTKVLLYIVIGKMSLVGVELGTDKKTLVDKNYKPGLTGLVQINKFKIEDEESRDNFELYYLQNYSIWMDVDILAKSLMSKYSLQKQINESA